MYKSNVLAQIHPNYPLLPSIDFVLEAIFLSSWEGFSKLVLGLDVVNINRSREEDLDMGCTTKTIQSTSVYELVFLIN